LIEWGFRTFFHDARAGEPKAPQIRLTVASPQRALEQAFDDPGLGVIRLDGTARRLAGSSASTLTSAVGCMDHPRTRTMRRAWSAHPRYRAPT